MGGGDVLSPDSRLEDFLLELSGKPRPRVGFLPTAGGERPESIQWFYDAFAGRDCEPSHLELFGMPEEPAAQVAAQDVIYVVRRQHGEHARDLARARRRRRAARGVGARRRPRRLERRRELLVRGLRHRLLRPAPARARRRARLPAGSFCPHYDGEPERRPTYTRLVRDGVLAPGYAADDDAAFHFEGTELREVVSQREGARGYRVGADGEQPLEARRAVKRVAIVASASGSGKTTLGRELARRLDVPFHRGRRPPSTAPNWIGGDRRGAARARAAAARRASGWVVDGTYRSKLGDLVLERADIVVWLDLPRRVWLPRLLRRTVSRIVRPRGALEREPRDAAERSLQPASRSSVSRCGRNYRAAAPAYPAELAPYPHVRLRTPAAVARWLDDYSSSAISAAARDAPSVSTGR